MKIILNYEETERQALLRAIARGWSHPKNENKEMDSDLAFAIAEEVSKFYTDRKHDGKY